MSQKGEKLYEGKAKIVYFLEGDTTKVIHHFKDDATAGDGAKKGTIAGKGAINAQISAICFQHLRQQGIATHFVEFLPPNELVTERLQILLVEVIFRNIVAGSLSERLGITQGTQLRSTIVDFHLKDDALGDPLLTDEHAIKVLQIVTELQCNVLRSYTYSINNSLRRLFESCGLILVDGKLEFGLDEEGRIILADEISPDTLRLWDAETGRSLDKDRFRRDLGEVENAYQEVLNRLKQVTAEPTASLL